MNPVMVAKKMDDIPINFVEQSECKHKRNNFRKRKISDEVKGYSPITYTLVLIFFQAFKNI